MLYLLSILHFQPGPQKQRVLCKPFSNALKDALRARPRDLALLRYSGVFREARMHKTL